MPEGYLVTHPDGTRHAVAKVRAMTDYLQVHNSRCKDDEKLKYVTMEYSEAIATIEREGVRDNSHSAVPKVGMLQSVVKSQQSEIEMLKAQIELLNQLKSEPTLEPLNVVKTLALLETFTTVEQVKDLLVGEERATVINAANKLIKKLS